MILKLHQYSFPHSFTVGNVLHLPTPKYVLTMKNQGNKLAALSCVRWFKKENHHQNLFYDQKLQR